MLVANAIPESENITGMDDNEPQGWMTMSHGTVSGGIFYPFFPGEKKALNISVWCVK